MKRIALAILLALQLSPAAAFWQSRDSNYNVAVSSGGGACPSATFIARASLTGSDATNYTNLICGLFTDGLITGNLSTTGCGASFDALYIFATVSSAVALLNICGTNYTVLNSWPLTFTAYNGFTGIGNVNSGLDTQFNPTTATSPNFVQDAAHLSLWALGVVTPSVSSISDNGGTINNIYPRYTDNNFYARINDGGAPGFSITTQTGHFLGNRSSSTARQGYQNASTTLAGGTVVSYGSIASVAPANNTIKILGNNGGGTLNQIAAMASIGGSLTSTQVTNFYNRLRTYMTAVGVP